ncbi:hypothetical protein ACH5RR_009045 [Cinchona calisaya]|uniref:hAT-like transposase RNase-H fold domain-containing protein n=1 Tax=Cinchona calisaya TaxID=153742 RepID=A0ABD3ADU1_9GENT
MGENRNITADSSCPDFPSLVIPSGSSQPSSKVGKAKAAIPSLPCKKSKVTTTTTGGKVRSWVFYDTTVRLLGSLYVVGNQYMVEIYTIVFFLIRLMEGSDEHLAAMAPRMKKKHDRNWANVDKINVLLVIAVVLDLHFKL